MARQRASAGGGPQDVGFLRRLFRNMFRRRERGPRQGARVFCESYMYRWEWLDENGNRVAAGTHAVVRPAGSSTQGTASIARAQVQRQSATYLAQLAGRYPGGRLRVTRVGDIVSVPGPC